MATHSLHELARIAGAELAGDPSLKISGTAALRDARAGDISFCKHSSYAAELTATQASAVIVPPDLAVSRRDLALLRCDDVNGAFTRVCALFAAERPRPAPGVHPSSVVHPRAKLGEGVAIGPLCVIGAEAEIGARSVLHGHVYVGGGVRIGAETEVHPGAVFYAGVGIGARCVIHSGVVIGADGFGYEPPKAPGEPWRKVPQSGTVVIEDEVEIGANTTVDRARFGTTRVGRGAKLDNLVQVGHNCEIGAGAMLAAQAGLAGSTIIGRGVLIGGQAGLAGHMKMGDGARLAAQSGVKEDIPAGEDWFGSPARPALEAYKLLALYGRLPRMQARIVELERRLAALEGKPEARP